MHGDVSQPQSIWRHGSEIPLNPIIVNRGTDLAVFVRQDWS
jgi:hypothetical protein